MEYAKIEKIYLYNFKKHKDTTIAFNPVFNIFVGDNGTGKSSVLQAIDLTLSGSISKVTTLGFDNILNADAVNNWLASPSLSSMPRLIIELFLSGIADDVKNQRLYGEKFSNNHQKKSAYGIKLICEVNPDFLGELEKKIESGQLATFPYDYYMVNFSTFADFPYTKYLKPFHSVFIDNSSINAAKTMQFVIDNIYNTSTDSKERISLKQKFRDHIEKFELPKAADKNGLFISADLEDFLDIKENGIRLQNSGQGQINVYKTQSALNRNIHESSVFMFEEPENHLSYKSLRFLIERIETLTAERQLFIATHSSYITSRLGLQNVFFVGDTVCSLADLPEPTSRFFQKAPNDNLLQFVLSKKVLLVEGAAEYILADEFAKKITGNNLDELGIWVIALNNLSFARYLELAQKLGIKVAVVRDNDGVDKEWYKEYKSQTINVFVEEDLSQKTFEICLYERNKVILDLQFLDKGDTLKYMLSNKAEAAFSILESCNDIVVPEYISEAIRWLNS